jgi:cobalt-precorrin-5B (C1)-methyltransferase
MVTRPGLPIAVGEPAINPVPRQMMRQVVDQLAAAHGVPPDFALTLAVRDGARLAEKTWNPRLGIVGGLSILGTTGIVVPYSCSAWIHSIHRGVDVARAMGLDHVVGSTGDLSEQAAMRRLGLPMESYIDMGDFVGGLLKYLKAHPVPRVTIAGGFGKLSKLAQGAMDLHSGRSQVDLDALGQLVERLGGDTRLADGVRGALSANAALALASAAGIAMAPPIAALARTRAAAMVGDKVQVDILVVDRAGVVIGESS